MISQVKLGLARTGNDSTVEVDGVDITNRISRLVITTGVGNVTELVLEYACVDVLAHGSAVVRHVCPNPPDPGLL